MSEAVATITVLCATHGPVDLPGDAVYLRHRPIMEPRDGFTPPTARCATLLCHDHVIRRYIDAAEWAALRSAGAVEIDEPTAVLLLRLASPCDAGMASRALREVEDVERLRVRAAVQAGRHLYAVSTDVEREQHVVAVATTFRERLETLGGER